MSSAKITLFSFYDYMRRIDDDLFKYLELPAGVNSDTLINTILMNGGEYEVLYADPTFMQYSIKGWSEKWYHTIARWVRALNEEYNPLHNYDRTETETRTPDITKQRTPNLTGRRTADLTDTNGGTITEENTRSAYDSSNYEPDAKTVTTPQNTIHTTGTDTVTETGTETNKETGTESWNRRAYGNIGVTTSQQMLESELKVAEWSLYDSIARLFLSEYVIPVMV